MDRVECEIGIFKGYTGSSKFSCNETTSICTIDGPNHTLSRNEDVDALILDIKWKDTNIFNSKIYEKYYSTIVKSILLKYLILDIDKCKSITISFYLTGLTHNFLFCSINSALLALLDGGIPLRHMFFASSSFKKAGEIFVYKEDEIDFKHCFGDYNELNIEKVDKYVKYIKEVLLYTIKNKK